MTMEIIKRRLQDLGLAPDHFAEKVDGFQEKSTQYDHSTSVVRAAHYAAMREHSLRGWPILLFGFAATGKTMSVRQLADESGAKLYVQQSYRTVGVEEIRGTRGLDEKGTTFEPGTLTRSLEDPCGWYLQDEINMADPAILPLANNLLDGSGEITIPETGQVLRKRDNWRFFATFNPGFVGTSEMNEALISRCYVIECDYFEPEVEAEFIRQRYPAIGSRATTIVRIAQTVRSSRESNQHNFDMCLRTCFQFAEDWIDSGDPLEAFRVSVLPKIGDRSTFGPVRDGLFEAVEFMLSQRT